MHSRETQTSNIHLARSDGYGIELFRVPFKCCAAGCTVCSGFGPDATVVPDPGTHDAAPSPPATAAKQQQKQKSPKAQQTKKQQIIAQNAREREDSEVAQLKQKLDTVAEREQGWEAKVIAQSKFIRSSKLDSAKTRSLALEVLAKSCFSWWKSARIQLSNRSHDTVIRTSALTLQFIQDSVRLYSQILQPKTVSKFCRMLG